MNKNMLYTLEHLVNQCGSTFDKCLTLLKVKNNDYANHHDPWKNLESCEKLGLCTTETGILLRLTDKFSRLTNLLSLDPYDVLSAVPNESVEDTIIDAINYLALLRVRMEYIRQLRINESEAKDMEYETHHKNISDVKHPRNPFEYTHPEAEEGDF